MAQTTFGDLTTFGTIPSFGFGSTPMTLMELMGAMLKGLGEVQTALSTLTSTPMSISLTSANLNSIANSILSYDITNLDSNTTKYNLDNAIRAQLLHSVTNNHSTAGDTLTTLKTDGTTSKTVFTKTTNKRGEMEKIK